MNGNEIRIAVLSDSHGWLRRCVVREVQDCSHILHAGDIIHESDLDELALYGQLYAVKGNNDWWMQGVRDLAGYLRFRIGGVNFLMVHDRMDVPREVSNTVYGLALTMGCPGRSIRSNWTPKSAGAGTKVTVTC